MKKILVVDDEQLIRWSLQRDLQKAGYAVNIADSAEEALRSIREDTPQLVLLDHRLPGKSGLSVLPAIKAHDPQIQVIMMSAHMEVESVVEAMKAGAFHCVHKPFNHDELHMMIAKALEPVDLRGRLARARLHDEARMDDFIGDSAAARETRSMAARASESPAATILLQGESGTGKDLLARVIHSQSPRREHPFLTINCSALPENLLESELFGFERGAFTDARQSKPGLFDEAGEGTVYLDEIGDMVPALQAKLLSVIETRRFRPLGATRELQFRARIIAATNRDLKVATLDGSFREDLFYRLNVLPIRIPPLRDRREDIMPLARHFLSRLARDYHRPMRDFSNSATDLLNRHAWPGNVRELRNLIERIVILESVEIVDVEQIPVEFTGSVDPGTLTPRFRLPAEGISLDELEADLIRQAMEISGGNQTQAAKLLGLTRDTLRYRLSKLPGGASEVG